MEKNTAAKLSKLTKATLTVKMIGSTSDLVSWETRTTYFEDAEGQLYRWLSNKPLEDHEMFNATQVGCQVTLTANVYEGYRDWKALRNVRIH